MTWNLKNVPEQPLKGKEVSGGEVSGGEGRTPLVVEDMPLRDARALLSLMTGDWHLANARDLGRHHAVLSVSTL